MCIVDGDVPVYVMVCANSLLLRLSEGLHVTPRAYTHVKASAMEGGMRKQISKSGQQAAIRRAAERKK